LYNRCTGIYKFGNNTYPRCIRRRSNLGHIVGGKMCVLWAGKYSVCVCTRVHVCVRVCVRACVLVTHLVVIHMLSFYYHVRLFNTFQHKTL
jgi:hypothetical protein